MVKRRKRRYEPQKCNGRANIVVWDNETGECIGLAAQMVGRLNLQNDIINDKEEEINKLKKKIGQQEIELKFREIVIKSQEKELKQALEGER